MLNTYQSVNVKYNHCDGYINIYNIHLFIYNFKTDDYVGNNYCRSGRRYLVSFNQNINIHVMMIIWPQLQLRQTKLTSHD
jgi:hypothetical protein